MSVIPGYDFTPTELVTANKLFRWLVGTYVDPNNKEDSAAHGFAGYAVGTGSTAVSLANEGQLFYNKTTHRWEVNTRWGLTPLFGGNMFTKRIASFQNGAAGDRMRFFSTVVKICHMGGSTRFTVSSPTLLETDWESVAQARTAKEGVGAANGQVLGFVTLWPSLDNHGPSGELTEVSSWTGLHRLMCIRGFTPICASMHTAASNSRAAFSITDGMVSFRYAADPYKPYPFGVYGYLEIADYYKSALPGVSNTLMGYVNPSVGSNNGGSNYAMINLRV